MARSRAIGWLARSIATGGGTGYAPHASGTVAAVAAAIIGTGLLLIGPWALAIGVLLALAAGFWAIGRLNVAGDPGWVVIDEVVGQWIALFAAFRPSLITILAAFLFFRAFDILKPGPVHWVERWPGALGVIADDVLAGIFAAVLLLACRFAFPDFFAVLSIPA